MIAVMIGRVGKRRGKELLKGSLDNIFMSKMA